MRLIWIITIIFSVTACSIVPLTSPLPVAPATKEPWQTREAALNRLQNWEVKGKIALQTAQDSGTANVTWIQSGRYYTISMIGPLGTNSLKITGRPGFVTLDMANGKHYSARTVEQLLAEQWNFQPPVSDLYYWIRGLPVPGVPATKQWDAAGRLSRLTQQGSQIQFLSYTQSGALDLPSKVWVTSPDLKVKIVIYRWH